MNVEFTKMNGAGNDFVVVDNRTGKFRPERSTIARLCDRRRGIGADGLILIDPSQTGDFFMSFFNSDGTAAEMCGNGSRCAAAFAVSLGLGRPTDDGTRVRFETGSGSVGADVRGRLVRTELMDARDMRRGIALSIAPGPSEAHFMTVGTRHVVIPVDDAAAMSHDDVVSVGRAVRNDVAFSPVGANVNFASIGAQGEIHIRTYEKGVEDETHACGTGSVACAVYFAHSGRLGTRATVVQHSGDRLDVCFELQPGGASHVVIEGPVEVNFSGILDV